MQGARQVRPPLGRRPVARGGCQAPCRSGLLSWPRAGRARSRSDEAQKPGHLQLRVQVQDPRRLRRTTQYRTAAKCLHGRRRVPLPRYLSLQDLRRVHGIFDDGAHGKVPSAPPGALLQILRPLRQRPSGAPANGRLDAGCCPREVLAQIRCDHSRTSTRRGDLVHNASGRRGRGGREGPGSIKGGPGHGCAIDRTDWWHAW